MACDHLANLLLAVHRGQEEAQPAALSSTAGCRIGCTLIPRPSNALESFRQCIELPRMTGTTGEVFAHARIEAPLLGQLQEEPGPLLQPADPLRLGLQEADGRQGRGACWPATGPR